MCGIIGVIDRRRQLMDGGKIRDSLAMMDERGSGEGAGYVAYGIYPDYKDYFALHVFFDNIRENKGAIDTLLEKWGTIIHDEQIKTYAQPNLRKVHTPWRYFFRPDRNLMPKSTTPDEDIITYLVMKVNSEKNGALVFSSGKNLGFSRQPAGPKTLPTFTGLRITRDISGLPTTGTRPIPPAGGVGHTRSTFSTGALSITGRLHLTVQTGAISRATGINARCIPIPKW